MRGRRRQTGRELRGALWAGLTLRFFGSDEDGEPTTTARADRPSRAD